MPLKTFASIPARAYGFTALSGGNYWMAHLAGAGQDYAYSIKCDSAGVPWISGGIQIGGVYSGVFGKIATTGTSIDLQVAANGTGQTQYYALATDGSNWYAAGINQPSGVVGVLVKYNGSGVIQWQRKLTPSANSAYAYDIEVDSSGNVFVSGQGYNGNYAVNLPWVVKYNSAGALQWQYFIYNSAVAGTGFAVALDSSSNVQLWGNINSNGAAGMKLNSAGTVSWVNRYSSNLADLAYAATTEQSTGDTYIAGRYGSTTGTFLAKIATGGTITWQRTLNTAAYAQQTQVAVDSTGNVYLLFGQSQVAKYNSSGTIQWQRSLTNGAGSITLGGIAVDNLGSMYLIGYNNVSSASDMFVAKLPTDGTKTGTYTLGSSSYTWAASTWTDAAGSGTMAATGSQSIMNLTDAAGTLTTATPGMNITKATV